MKSAYHHGDLKEALVGAALAAVAETGVAGFSLRDLAKRVGVSPAAPYRHFPDKAALLAAVAEQGFHTLTRMMKEAQAVAGSDPVARFQALGITYVRFAVGHRAHFRVMFGPEAAEKAQHPALQQAEAAAFDLCVTAIQDGQAAGRIRSGDAVELALSAWALVHGLSGLILDGLVDWAGKGEVPTPLLAQRIGELLFTGLRACD